MKLARCSKKLYRLLIATVDLLRKWPNPCFCWQARYFQHVAGLRSVFKIWRESFEFRSIFAFPNLIKLRSENWSNLLENRCKIRVIRGPACSNCDQNFGSCIFSGSDLQNCPIWCSTDAPGTLSGHPRIVPGTLQAVPGHYLGTLGPPRRVPGPTSGRFWVPRGPKLLQISSKFRRKFDHISTEIRSKIGEKLIKVGSRFDQNSTLIKNLDRNCWSTFLIKFLDQISWSNFLIKIVDRISWSHLLIYLSDHDLFLYRSLF